MGDKANLRKKGLKMNLAISKKNSKAPVPSKAVIPYMKLSPLSEVCHQDICYKINKSLFKLEKDVALFHFAIQEIKDIN